MQQRTVACHADHAPIVEQHILTGLGPLEDKIAFEHVARPNAVVAHRIWLDSNRTAVAIEDIVSQIGADADEANVQGWTGRN